MQSAWILKNYIQTLIALTAIVFNGSDCIYIQYYAPSAAGDVLITTIHRRLVMPFGLKVVQVITYLLGTKPLPDQYHMYHHDRI